MGLEYKTLKDWNVLGYWVKKGEHAHKRDANGTPLFSETQVWCTDEDVDYDDPYEYGINLGDTF